jgi:hypothetical protein
LTALGVLAVQVAALVEDLKTTGVPDAATRPLEELLAEIRSLLAKARPSKPDIDQHWTRAEEVLQAFCQDTGTAPARDRRKGFWK